MADKVNKNVTSDVLKSDTKKVDEISVQDLEVLKADAGKVAGLLAEVETLKADKEGIKIKITALTDSLGDNTVEDLLKAKQELVDIAKAKAEKQLEDAVDVVKGFNLFEDEAEAIEVAKFITENDCKATGLILAGLEKSRDIIKSFATDEHGTDLENKADTVQGDVEKTASLVMDKIKRNRSKEV